MKSNKKYKFTKSTPIKDVLADKRSIEIINSICPFILLHPIIKYASKYPLRIIRFVDFSSDLKFSKYYAKRLIKEILKIEKEDNV